MKNKAPYETQHSIKTGLLLLCLGIFLWAPSVFAVGNIHLGRLEIHPEISYKGEYNDNIFFENENKEDDFIHHIIPGVGFKFYGLQNTFFSAGYKVDVARYNDFDDNNYEDHQGFVTASIKTPKGFFVRVQDRFQDTGDPFGSEEEFRVGVQTERWNNRARLNAGFEFAEKYGIEGIYENFRARYDLIKDQFEDKIENIYGCAVLYKVTGKTSLLVQYLREDIEYDGQNDGVDAWSSANSQDYSTNNFLIGARFEPGGKLTGEFKFGYGTIEFENYADKNGNVYNDDSFWIVQADVGYKPVEKTSLSLIINRSKEASTSADISGDVSAAYLRTSVGIALTQTFTDRISMNLGFDWSHKDYLDESSGNPDKSFDLYTAKGGVDYLIREWLKIGMEYKYQDNQVSNTLYEADEYTVNSVAIQVGCMF